MYGRVVAAGLAAIVSAAALVSVSSGRADRTAGGPRRLSSASSAASLTRAQADAIALRVLHPQRTPGRVVLFGLTSPLAASQSVAIASLGHEGDRPETRGLRPVGRRAWLFWEDLRYDARFEHPSRLLLVDDATGQTLERSLEWFPLVDGRKPPFLARPSGYASPRYIVYSSVKLTRRSHSSSHSITRAPAARRFVLPPNAFAGDCMIMIGRFSDPFFTPDFTGMANFALRAGLRTWWAAAGTRPSAIRPPSDKEAGRGSLPENVSWLIDNEHCRDVFIYVDGHGTAAPRPAAIDLGDGKKLDPSDLRGIIAAHPEVSFKLKLDACYAGRFLAPLYKLKEQPNLLVAEASSRDTELSWLTLDDPRNANGDLVKRKLDNPGRSEFTNANIAGLEHFASSKEEVSTAVAEGGDLLAHALADSFYDGAGSDAARLAGLTHPILYTNFPAAPPPVPPPTPTLTCTSPLAFFDPTELKSTLECNQNISGFIYLAPPGFAITNHLPANCIEMPSELDCSKIAISANTPFSWNIQTNPAPTPGFGGTIRIFQLGTLVQTFTPPGP